MNEYMYNLVFEEINNRYINGVLTFEQANEVNDLAYERYINEAEEDHISHMEKKKAIASGMHKDVNTLHNKKYDKPETAKKADYKYAYDDKQRYIGYKKIKDELGEDKVTSVQKRPLYKKGEDGKLVKRTNGGIVDHYNLSEGLKDSDIKKLEYMKKHCNPQDKDELRKYQAAFNMFVSKFGIKPNSSIYVHLDPKNPNNWEGEHQELVEYTKSADIASKIPSNMHLVHMTNKDGLTELMPQMYSGKYNKSGTHQLSGRYSDEGRVYFVILNKNEKFQNISNTGKHSYELINVPSKGIYIDKEMGMTHSLDKLMLKDKLGVSLNGLAVYVQTDKPLKVQQLQ